MKRKSYPGKYSAARRRNIRMRKRMVVRAAPGFTRTTGFYGRYQPSGNELKFLDTAVTSPTTIPIAGSILADSINVIPQGNGPSARIGRKVTIRSINWHWEILKQTHTTGSSGTEYVRVVLYLDKQCNGTAAVPADIMATSNYLSFRNLANTGRFSILMDKSYMIKDQAAAGNGTTDRAFETGVRGSFYKKCKIPIEYDSTATTGALTTIRSNNLGVLLFSRTGALTSFTSTIRLRYSDS